jgi:hypothetical protein
VYLITDRIDSPFLLWHFPGEQRIVTPLERVIGGGVRGPVDMAKWEPFRNVDMDAQVITVDMLLPHFSIH